MTLLEMSSKTFHSSKEEQPYELIYEEVMDHMKRSGAFDEIRVKLVEPLSTDPDYKVITEKFIQECNIWCQHIDLSQTRNAVRAKMSQRFTVDSSGGYSGSKRDLEALIRRIVKERKPYIQDELYKHARSFLRKFLPEPSPPLKKDTPEHVLEPEPEPKIESEPKLEHKTQSEPLTDLKPLAADDIEVELEPVKTNHENIQIQVENDVTETVNEKSATAPVEEEDMDIESNADDIERPQYSPIQPNLPSLDEIPMPPVPPAPNDTMDDDDRLTFDSVSTVNTADLTDFELDLELAEDEATLLKLPKNQTKISVKKLQEDIDELETRYQFNKESDDTTNEQSESTTGPHEASESDGGTSESAATERRASRTRKSNPRYNNQDFKLYKS